MQTKKIHHTQNLVAGAFAAVLTTALVMTLPMAVSEAGTSTEIFLESTQRLPANTLNVTLENNALAAQDTPVCVQSPAQHLGCVPNLKIDARSTATFAIFIPETQSVDELRFSYRDADGDWHEIIRPQEFQPEYSSQYILYDGTLESSDTVSGYTTRVYSEEIGGHAAMIPADLQVE